MKKYIVGLIVALLSVGTPYMTSVADAAPKPSSSSSSTSSGASRRPSSPAPAPSPSRRPTSPTPAPKPTTPTAAPKPAAPTNSATPSRRPGSPSSSDDDKKKDTSTSQKPVNKNFDATAASAKQQSESRQKFVAAQPKPEYKTPSGQTVKIDPNSTSTQRVRSVTPESIAQRPVRVENHYHNYYGSRYDDYLHRPYINIGGGYSTLFWWSMLDNWDDNRKAQWFYNNQSIIDQNLLNQQLQQNAVLRARIEEMRRSGVKPDPNYVDPEFRGNEDLMYDQHFVSAAYPVQAQSTGFGKVCAWIGFGLLLVLVGVTVWYFVFKKTWNSDRYE